VYFISRWVYRNLQERNEALAFAVYMILQILLSFLAMIPISWFSRRREFAADAFSARVYGKNAMISALQAIDRWVSRAQVEYSTQDPLATMKISGKTRGMFYVFATHPPIDERVAALQRL
jgi:heat shock protein HtpX